MGSLIGYFDFDDLNQINYHFIEWPQRQWYLFMWLDMKGRNKGKALT